MIILGLILALLGLLLSVPVSGYRTVLLVRGRNPVDRRIGSNGVGGRRHYYSSIAHGARTCKAQVELDRGFARLDKSREPHSVAFSLTREPGTAREGAAARPRRWQSGAHRVDKRTDRVRVNVLRRLALHRECRGSRDRGEPRELIILLAALGGLFALACRCKPSRTSARRRTSQSGMRRVAGLKRDDRRNASEPS